MRNDKKEARLKAGLTCIQRNNVYPRSLMTMMPLRSIFGY
jgi:hypothetical protein